ncbi:acyl- N-acyltransferase like [Lecanosticta acicola]|uniref:Acyl- N-acyltransferase like n=1 Tax=Lecanosticta acicola TaxID=111012 RepID=A0AAI8Z8K1_9PEZI|nr:acyl- N-acyltransferase like [Lecanosticta acicola]
MPLQLTPLPRDEWETYFRLAWTAFSPGIMEAMYPNGYSDEAVQQSLAALKRRADRHPERYWLFKVEDTDLPDDDQLGKAVGVSQWQIFPKEKTDKDVEREEKEGDADDQQFPSPPGRNTRLGDAFSSASNAKKEEYLGRRPHVLLQAIGTRPGFERRGVAGLSLAWGTRRADEMGLPAYLEASDKGVELYKRWGFEAVGPLPFDATEYGYSDPLRHTCMLRPSGINNGS